MKNKSKSYSFFKIRELSQSEKVLLSKYSTNKNQKSQIDINTRKKCYNLKLNLYDKKIVKLRNENRDNLSIKHFTNNNNYYNSIFANKKNKEYFHKLYNDENKNLTNIYNTNNTNDISECFNYTKNNFLSKTKKIFQNTSNYFSYKNIFERNNQYIIPNLLLKTEKYETDTNLNNDIINNKLYSITNANNNSIDPYYFKYGNSFEKNIIKKTEPKKIKNKIIAKAVNILRKKRDEKNKSKEIKKTNSFKVPFVYNNIKLKKNLYRNKKTLFKFSSIRTELINKNKKFLFE